MVDSAKDKGLKDSTEDKATFMLNLKKLSLGIHSFNEASNLSFLLISLCRLGHSQGVRRLFLILIYRADIVLVSGSGQGKYSCESGYFS
jgi:hypothetical protein